MKTFLIRRASIIVGAYFGYLITNNSIEDTIIIVLVVSYFYSFIEASNNKTDY